MPDPGLLLFWSTNYEVLKNFPRRDIATCTRPSICLRNLGKSIPPLLGEGLSENVPRSSLPGGGGEHRKITPFVPSASSEDRGRRGRRTVLIAGESLSGKPRRDASRVRDSRFLMPHVFCFTAGSFYMPAFQMRAATIISIGSMSERIANGNEHNTLATRPYISDSSSDLVSTVRFIWFRSGVTGDSIRWKLA